MAAATNTPGDEPSDADLEERLERTEQRLQAVRERYERLIDERARLRRETPPDDQCVWTDPSREEARPGSPGRSRDADRACRTDGGRDRTRPGLLARLLDRLR